MKNEYGVKLDRNGYAPSIIPDHGPCRCWLCGQNGTRDKLDRHEVFGGPYRGRSKALGLWVYLCHSECHEGNHGVHRNAPLALYLKQVAQTCAMEAYDLTTGDFVARFGKNYLEESDDTKRDGPDAP